MIHGDATAAALAAVLEEQEAVDDRAARAGHALAEAEERAEEDPAAAAGLEACRRRAEAAEEWLAEVRRRRRDLEERLDEREALRVHASRCGRAGHYSATLARLRAKKAGVVE